MFDLIKSIRFALSGIFDGLKNERNFRLQWLCAAVVLFSIAHLPFLVWQKTVILLLIFFVLCFELLNCAIERVCDSSGKGHCQEKKRAKDFSAASVFLFCCGAALLFLYFILVNLHDVNWYENLLPIILLVSMFILSLPLVLAKTFSAVHFALFFIGTAFLITDILIIGISFFSCVGLLFYFSLIFILFTNHDNRKESFK